MAVVTLDLPFSPFDASPDWYRLRSVKVAFVASLLVHAAAIALIPTLRVPELQKPPPLTVELAPEPPPPPPEPKPEIRPVPPPVVKAIPKPTPPPPVPEVRPEPKPEPPPPVPEARAPTPPPQPIVVPQRPAPQPEPQVTAPPRVEPPPEARVEPPPAAPAPPPRAQAPPSPPALDSSVLHDYGAVVSNAIAKKKVYPRMALMRRWQGTTNLKLQIAADGNLKALSVARSSGFEILDEQAVKMVKDSLPLPNLPDALRGREFAIDLPVAFKLQD